MKTPLLKFIGFVIVVALAVFLYMNIQRKSTVGCYIDPGSIKLSNIGNVYKNTNEIAEEIFAKYLESHNIGKICFDRAVSGYKIDQITLKKEADDSFVAHVVFDISPLDTGNSSWFKESPLVENLYVKNLERDFIVNKDGDLYSILDVIE